MSIVEHGSQNQYNKTITSGMQQQRPDGLWEGTANIGGLYCGACAWDIEATALNIPGISSFTVNPASGLGYWVATDQNAINQLRLQIEKQGYYFLSGDLTARELGRQQHQTMQRQQFLRWMIGLLCAVQIMMYAGPEYFYSVADLEKQSVQILRWAQWVLVLPILLYSAQPLFSRAFLAASQKRWAVEQPVVLGISLAFVFSSLQLFEAQGHVWFDSIAMLVTFLGLSRWLIERAARRAVLEVLSMAPDLPETIERKVGGQWVRGPVSQLQAGELFRLHPGVSSPVDARLAALDSMAWFDESLLTGESTPVQKHASDVIDAGSRPVGEGVELIVIRSTVGRYLQNLSGLLSRAMAQRPVWQSHLDVLLPWFVGVVFSLAGGVAVLAFLQGQSSSYVIEVAVTMLLVACPCALALSWPLVRLFTMVRLQRDGILVARPECLEKLAKVAAITWDKTGTLAPVNQAVVEWHHCSGDAVLFQWSKQLVQHVAVLMVRHSAHPVARALVQFLGHQCSPVYNHSFVLENVNEVQGAGVRADLRDLVTQKKVSLRLGSAGFCEVQQRDFDHSMVYFCIESQVRHDQSLPASSFKILAMAYISWGPVVLSTQGFEQLNNMGIKQYLVSGDHEKAVRLWASQLNFERRYWQQTAEQKADRVHALQAQGHLVAMIGDGLNDSVAFAQADVAIACKNAAALSAQQADMLLPQKALARLPFYISICRKANKIGQQNMWGSLFYNLLAMLLAATGMINPLIAALGMGLSSLLVFLNAARLGRMGTKV